MSTTTYTVPFASPVGPLVLESDGDILIGIWLPNHGATASGGTGEVPTVLKETATQLDEYFSGERTDFDVPMELDGTPFQVDVWTELSRIPYGETISYGELARRVGRPKGPRAVGQANGRHRRLRRGAAHEAGAARSGGCHCLRCPRANQRECPSRL
jgi:methylated-DNA-[protein]-cysteine S-methyltransferase